METKWSEEREEKVKKDEGERERKERKGGQGVAERGLEMDWPPGRGRTEEEGEDRE